jgi:hypothetical protein
MPRRILGFNGLSDFFAYQQQREKQGTVELYFGKGFTPEEEDREVKSALRFYEGINDFAHPRTQRLKIIHDDGSGRPPYFVNLYGRGLTT